MPTIAPANFWIVTRPPWGFDVETCQRMIDAVLAAMTKALASGVVEYHIGSRGLKRFTVKELQDLLLFCPNQLQAAIYGSSIICRRGVPTDY